MAETEPMRRRTNMYPDLEPLESLSLLSGAAAAMMHHVHAQVSNGGTIELSGTEHGAFYARKTSSRTTETLFATTDLAPVGFESTTGTLHVNSGISSGPPSGTLRVITGRGTLRLQIPKSVALPAGLPAPTSPHEIVDTYIITKGTGAYRHDTGSGVVEITVHNAIPTVTRFQAGVVDITFSTLAS
jgi:hypothetical protein